MGNVFSPFPFLSVYQDRDKKAFRMPRMTRSDIKKVSFQQKQTKTE